MIGGLKGVVAAVAADAALIEVQGVSYVVAAGSRTLGRLAVGEAARLVIETQVREDSIRLFGFLSEEERVWFAHLQSVQGVGAKAALALLDALAPADLAQAILAGDKASLSRASGVGAKLAARIAQELQGKPPPLGFLGAHGAMAAPEAAPVAAHPARSEALSALVNLGIDQASAARAVAAAAKAEPEADAAGLIRAALKEVGR